MYRQKLRSRSRFLVILATEPENWSQNLESKWRSFLTFEVIGGRRLWRRIQGNGLEFYSFWSFWPLEKVLRRRRSGLLPFRIEIFSILGFKSECRVRCIRLNRSYQTMTPLLSTMRNIRDRQFIRWFCVKKARSNKLFK